MVRVSLVGFLSGIRDLRRLEIAAGVVAEIKAAAWLAERLQPLDSA